MLERQERNRVKDTRRLRPEIEIPNRFHVARYVQIGRRGVIR
jgi:hypothetical protein